MLEARGHYLEVVGRRSNVCKFLSGFGRAENNQLIGACVRVCESFVSFAKVRQGVSARGFVNSVLLSCRPST